MRFREFEGEGEKKKLGEVLIKGKLGGNYENSDSNNGLPVIKMGNIGRGEILLDKIQYLPQDEKYDNEDILKDGDLLFNTRNTLELVGKVAIWRNEIPFALYNSNLMRIKLNDLFEPSNRFLNAYFNTRKAIGQLRSFATGTTSVAAIYSRDLGNFLLSFPSITEQQKIASFLSLVDARIATQSKIIEGLIGFKSALSKKIFSQQFRFPEFNEEWKEIRMGEACEIIGGGTPDTNKSEYWNGNIQWFIPTEIKTNFISKSERTISKLGLQNSSAKILPKGTILLTTRATIGEVAIALEECTTNQGFQSLVVKEGFNNIFVFNWIKENKYELVKRANGSTFPEISKSEIEKIEMQIPTLNEQTKIAQFLSDIDQKIEIETSISNLLIKQKQYLLQQMFT